MQYIFTYPLTNEVARYNAVLALKYEERNIQYNNVCVEETIITQTAWDHEQLKCLKCIRVENLNAGMVVVMIMMTVL